MDEPRGHEAIEHVTFGEALDVLWDLERVLVSFFESLSTEEARELRKSVDPKHPRFGVWVRMRGESRLGTVIDARARAIGRQSNQGRGTVRND